MFCLVLFHYFHLYYIAGLFFGDESSYFFEMHKVYPIFFFSTEVASRLSKRCTEQLVADNALSVIFKVVRNTNRSLAHIELIKHALAIFINVTEVITKYNKS